MLRLLFTLAYELTFMLGHCERMLILEYQNIALLPATTYKFFEK